MVLKFRNLLPAALAMLGLSAQAAELRTDFRSSLLLIPDGEDESQWYSSLRLKASGRPSEDIFLETHVVESWLDQTMLRGDAPPDDLDYRVAGLDFAHMEGPHSVATLGVDRLQARFSQPGYDLTLGRQPITFGTAFFWNPLDVFRPFATAALDRDFKPGVDAVRLDVPGSDFSGMTAVAAFGRNAEKSAFLARGHATVDGWDMAVQGGKMAHGLHLGGSLSGDVSGLEVRAEGGQFWLEGEALSTSGERLARDHFFGVFGLGRRFENGLHLEGEWAMNTLGDADIPLARERQAAGWLANAGRNMLAMSAAYELTPLVNGRLSAVISLSDGSFSLQPDMTVSLADEVDAVLSAALNAGGTDTEFGGQENTVFFQIRAAF